MKKKLELNGNGVWKKLVSLGSFFIFGGVNIFSSELPQLDSSLSSIQDFILSGPVQVISGIIIGIIAITMIVKRDSKTALVSLAVVMAGIVILRSNSDIIEFIFPS